MAPLTVSSKYKVQMLKIDSELWVGERERDLKSLSAKYRLFLTSQDPGELLTPVNTSIMECVTKIDHPIRMSEVKAQNISR